MSKLQELILYIARRSEDDPRFGTAKLRTLLYSSDFLAYAKLGRSISGEVYERLGEGPAPRGLSAAIHELGDDLAEAERDYCGLTQRRPIALREPDLAGFTGEEIALVDDVISQLRDGGAVMELSDRFPAWQVAEVGEEIPYATVFVGRPRPVTGEEAEFAKQVAEEIGCLATEAS